MFFVSSNLKLFFNLFSSREQALIFWLIILIVYALGGEKVRISFKHVLRSLLNKYIIIIFFLSFLYSFFEVLLLKKIGIWSPSLLKETIIWVFFSSTVAVAKCTSQKKEDELSIKRILKESITLFVIFEYFINLYTFHILVEIVLVPVVASLVLFAHYTRRTQENALAHKLANQIFSLFGLLLINFMIFSVKTEDVFSYETYIQIFLSGILAVLFYPFLYFVTLIVVYEGPFFRIRLALKNNKELIAYARKRLFLAGGFRLKKAQKVGKIISSEIWNNLNEKSIDRLFNRIKTGNQFKVGDRVILLATKELATVIEINGENVNIECSDGLYETTHVNLDYAEM